MVVVVVVPYWAVELDLGVDDAVVDELVMVVVVAVVAVVVVVVVVEVDFVPEGPIVPVDHEDPIVPVDQY